MTLPKDSELLGASPDELEIKGAGSHTIVRLDPKAYGKFVAGASQEPLDQPVYLLLENIRGTHDATVLSVYLDLPEGARPGDHRDHLVGSVALYGLRMASLRRGQTIGQGLTFVLDLPEILLRQLAVTRSLGAGEVRVSLVPERQLPDPTDITVGRVAFFRQGH